MLALLNITLGYEGMDTVLLGSISLLIAVCAEVATRKR